MYKNFSNEELIELYRKNKEFINYLEKEVKSVEKLRENND